MTGHLTFRGKLILTTCLIAALAGGVGMIAMSAVTVVPEAERMRSQINVMLLVTTVGWIGMAVLSWRKKLETIPAYAVVIIATSAILYALVVTVG